MFVMEPPSMHPTIGDRQTLLNDLLDAVKQCQIRFGGRTELATDSDSRVLRLCSQFETVFQHGLRRNLKLSLSAFRHVTEMMKGLNLLNNEPEPAYWHFVRNHLNKHEYERYMMLKNVATDSGRGRAWLRSALNEHSLERYIHIFLSDVQLVSQYYESWAFLMDQERSSMLPMMSAGLGSILFAISIDNPDLNNSSHSCTTSPPGGGSVMQSPPSKDLDPQPVVARPTLGSKKKRKKKRPSSQVVSFDDDDGSSGREWFLYLPQSCNSAPPTCLSSPVSLTRNFSALTGKESIHRIAKSSGGDSQLESDGQQSEAENPDGSELARSWTPGITVELARSEDDRDCGHTTQHLVKNHSFPMLGNRNDLSPTNPYRKVSSSNLAAATLTPISDTSVGELIPYANVPLSEDSVSIPSYGEETESAAVALAMAQRMAAWPRNPTTTSNTSSGSSHSAPTDRREWEGRTRSDTMTMTKDELREALLVVLQRKEETDEKNISLRNLLDREMEMSAGLRAEMEEIKKQNTERMEKLDTKIQATNRENELLKHQLKKYILAVQMLKRDGSRAQEALTNIVGDIQPAAPDPKQYIDHQYEATEYERKLVQVAEMHGELMEFNERLHRLLLFREATIRRLREELVDLRGPLPDDNQTSDDDISITSDYDASSQTASSRPLINIWVPSAFLSGRTTDVHHVYQVYIRIRDEEWNVYRRYSRFYSFHKALKKRFPIVHSFDFPPKKTINKKDCKVVEERRKRLQYYLRSVVNLFLQTSCELANNPDKETFMALLPFFRDQNSETRPPNQRRGFQRITPSNPQRHEEPAARLYTGL